MKLGVIADTHGLLRPEVVPVFEGVDLILHAGDIGDQSVIDGLASLADTVAIKGNIDRSGSVATYPDEQRLEIVGKTIYMLHNLKDITIDPAGEGIDLVISGHSHKPLVKEEQGVMYLNPGSAGRRRFSLPVAVALVNIDDELDARIVELKI